MGNYDYMVPSISDGPHPYSAPKTPMGTDQNPYVSSTNPYGGSVGGYLATRNRLQQLENNPLKPDYQYANQSYAQSNDDNAQQSAFAQQLQAMANGQVQAPADIAYQRQAQAAIAAQQAMARSQTGGIGAALARQQAARNGGVMQQQQAGQFAQMRALEQQQLQAQLAQALAQQRQQTQTSQGQSEQQAEAAAALAAQQQQFYVGQELGMNAQVLASNTGQSALAQQNQQFNQQLANQYLGAGLNAGGAVIGYAATQSGGNPNPYGS